MLQIHPNARTTPVTRAEIARSSEPSGTLAKRYGVGAETIRKWRKRGAGDCQDCKIAPKSDPAGSKRMSLIFRWGHSSRDRSPHRDTTF
jgi:hypothetical protein